MASMPLMFIGLGSQQPGRSRSWVEGDTQELWSPRPSDNNWHKCWCTGGGKGRYCLICCLQEESLHPGGAAPLLSLSGETGPKGVMQPSTLCGSWTVRVRDRLAGGDKRERVWGAAGAPTPGRGFTGVETKSAEWLSQDCTKGPASHCHRTYFSCSPQQQPGQTNLPASWSDHKGFSPGAGVDSVRKTLWWHMEEAGQVAGEGYITIRFWWGWESARSRCHCGFYQRWEGKQF